MDQNELLNSLDDKKMVQCTYKQLECCLLYNELMYEYDNKILDAEGLENFSYIIKAL